MPNSNNETDMFYTIVWCAIIFTSTLLLYILIGGAIEFLSDLDIMSIMFPIAISISLALITRNYAFRKSIQYKLLSLLILYVSIISVFGFFYFAYFNTSNPPAFTISTEFATLNNLSSVTNSQKDKIKYINCIYALDMLKEKSDSVLLIVNEINNTNNNIILNNEFLDIKCNLIAEMYFMGHTHVSHEQDSEVIEKDFFITNNNSVLYDFANGMAAKGKLDEKSLRAKIISATNRKELINNIDLLQTYFTNKIAAIDLENYKVLFDGKIKFEFSDFFLLSASKMIPLENPGIIAVSKTIKYLIFIQSLAGVFLVGFGLQILWNE